MDFLQQIKTLKLSGEEITQLLEVSEILDRKLDQGLISLEERHQLFQKHLYLALKQAFESGHN